MCRCVHCDLANRFCAQRQYAPNDWNSTIIANHAFDHFAMHLGNLVQMQSHRMHSTFKKSTHWNADDDVLYATFEFQWSREIRIRAVKCNAFIFTFSAFCVAMAFKNVGNKITRTHVRVAHNVSICEPGKKSADESDSIWSKVGLFCRRANP